MKQEEKLKKWLLDNNPNIHWKGCSIEQPFFVPPTKIQLPCVAIY